MLFRVGMSHKHHSDLPDASTILYRLGNIFEWRELEFVGSLGEISDLGDIDSGFAEIVF